MNRSGLWLALAIAAIAAAGWWWRQEDQVSARPVGSFEVQLAPGSSRDGVSQLALAVNWAGDGWWIVSADGKSVFRWRRGGAVPEPLDLGRLAGASARITAVAVAPDGELYLGDSGGRRLVRIVGESRDAWPAPYDGDPRASLVVRALQPARAGLFAWIEVASRSAIGSELWLTPKGGPARKLAGGVSGFALDDSGRPWVARPVGNATRLEEVDGGRAFDLPFPSADLICVWRDVACLAGLDGSLAVFRLKRDGAREVMRLASGGGSRWAGGPDGRVAVAAPQGDRITLRQWQLVQSRLNW